METLKAIEGINEAIKTIHHAKRDLASGSITLWRILNHAENHLDKQIKDLLAV